MLINYIYINKSKKSDIILHPVDSFTVYEKGKTLHRKIS